MSLLNIVFVLRRPDCTKVGIPGDSDPIPAPPLSELPPNRSHATRPLSACKSDLRALPAAESRNSLLVRSVHYYHLPIPHHRIDHPHMPRPLAIRN
jgi:hypothetical protein